MIYRGVIDCHHHPLEKILAKATEIIDTPCVGVKARKYMKSIFYIVLIKYERYNQLRVRKNREDRL